MDWITELPGELLVQISRYLNTSDRMRFKRVNSTWQDYLGSVRIQRRAIVDVSMQKGLFSCSDISSRVPTWMKLRRALAELLESRKRTLVITAGTAEALLPDIPDDPRKQMAKTNERSEDLQLDRLVMLSFLSSPLLKLHVICLSDGHVGFPALKRIFVECTELLILQNVHIRNVEGLNRGVTVLYDSLDSGNRWDSATTFDSAETKVEASHRLRALLETHCDVAGEPDRLRLRHRLQKQSYAGFMSFLHVLAEYEPEEAKAVRSGALHYSMLNVFALKDITVHSLLGSLR